MSPGLHIISSGHRDRWRCGPLMKHREGARQRRGDRQRDGGRCTVRRTQIHGYSNSAVLSQSYWKAVRSELSTEIRYWSFQSPPPLPLILSSFGTAHFPFWWFPLLHLVLLSLFVFLSVILGILVIYASLLPSLESSHLGHEKSWKKHCNAHLQNETFWDSEISIQ